MTISFTQFQARASRLSGKGFSKSTLNKIGATVARRIRDVTRSGFSIATGTKKKLKPLSDSYKQFRRGKATFWTHSSGAIIRAPFRSRRLRGVGRFFKPTKSNLTFTGKMIRSLTFRSNVSRQLVTVFTKGVRNRRVSIFAEDGGRPWIPTNKLDRVTQRMVDDIIEDAVDFEFS